MIPIAVAGLCSGTIFYRNNFEKPAIWIAVYSAIMKSLWGVLGGTIILGSALNTGCKANDFSFERQREEKMKTNLNISSLCMAHSF